MLLIGKKVQCELNSTLPKQKARGSLKAAGCKGKELKGCEREMSM
jgi:hypothetical protein